MFFFLQICLIWPWVLCCRFRLLFVPFEFFHLDLVIGSLLIMNENLKNWSFYHQRKKKTQEYCDLVPWSKGFKSSLVHSFFIFFFKTNYINFYWNFVKWHHPLLFIKMKFHSIIFVRNESNDTLHLSHLLEDDISHIFINSKRI